MEIDGWDLKPGSLTLEPILSVTMFYRLLCTHGFQALIHPFSNTEFTFILCQGLCQTPMV